VARSHIGVSAHLHAGATHASHCANVPSRYTLHTNEMRVGDYELSGATVQTITFVHDCLSPAAAP
jgi:hypothetical protein